MRIIVFFFLLALAGCTTRTDRQAAPESIRGYAPVYASVASYQNIELQAAKPTIQAGKIYAYGSYIF